MGRTYSREQLLQKCREALRDPGTFYAQGFVNYRGVCPDAQIPYTEIVAGFLCENLDAFLSGMQPITRAASYWTPGHDGRYDPNSNREEEVTAMQMFRACRDGACYAGIGRIIDYQTPLKSRQADKAGKIDLLAFDGKTLRLLELKKQSTGETMLRCALEGFTYLKTVDRSKLAADFSAHLGLPADAAVKASPLVFENSVPHREYGQDRPNLKKLMRLLDSEPFFLRKTGADFSVFSE